MVQVAGSDTAARSPGSTFGAPARGAILNVEPPNRRTVPEVLMLFTVCVPAETWNVAPLDTVIEELEEIWPEAFKAKTPPVIEVVPV
jgi:hypothetical protein